MRQAVIVLVAAFVGVSPAAAQQNDSPVIVRGFVTLGAITFDAQDSFDAVLDTHSGPIFGGGVQVLLPWDLFVEVGAARFSATGERAFIGPNRQVFRLGIPLEVKVTPIEITGGWRFRRWTRVLPYGGGGYSSYGYEETSDFAGANDNVNDRFAGFHVVGGAEVSIWPGFAVGGEVTWASVPNALGAAGVSAVYGEDNLGGTTLRLKLTVGR